MNCKMMMTKLMFYTKYKGPICKCIPALFAFVLRSFRSIFYEYLLWILQLQLDYVQVLHSDYQVPEINNHRFNLWSSNFTRIILIIFPFISLLFSYLHQVVNIRRSESQCFDFWQFCICWNVWDAIS